MLKRIFCILVTLLSALLLTCCGISNFSAIENGAAYPDTSSLKIHDNWYEEAVSTAAKQDNDIGQVDLWLSATQNTGGINPNEKSVYSHSGKKFCEGGFHYRYQDHTGWYASVLRCALTAGKSSRIRLLRLGNERFTDAFILEQGLADENADSETLNSIRRDLMTYAFNPKADLISTFSAEAMENSFYSLGTEKLCRAETLNQALLENPDLQEKIAQAQSTMVRRFVKGEAEDLTDLSKTDNPLCCALRNLDPENLSVITLDPADLENLNVREDTGKISEIVSVILKETGIFEKGLCAGLYAFTLDYAGQIGNIGIADLREPLIWGQLQYNPDEMDSEGILVMPRTLLTLVIGYPEQVEQFTEKWNLAMSQREELKEMRGPENGELCYCTQGATVIQEPFAFSFQYTQIERLSVQNCNNQMPDAYLSCENGEVSGSVGEFCVTLTPDENSALADTFIVLSFPVSDNSEEVGVAWETLSDVQVKITHSLLFDRVLENKPDAEISNETRVISYRDRLYCFSEDVQTLTPFAFAGAYEKDGTAYLRLSVNDSLLRAGCYHLHITAQADPESLDRALPNWISLLNAEVTEEDADTWEQFTAVISKNEQFGHSLSEQISHAWGGFTTSLYYGAEVPECPPVWKAFELKNLTLQLQKAADNAVVPLVNYEFEVFVTAQNDWFD